MNDIKWNGRRYAREDFEELRRFRRLWSAADKRRRRPISEQEAASRRLFAKRRQFDMALHRRGLTSPFDYEYPRFKQMNKLARELFNRHVQPAFDAAHAYERD
jgi:hypothetical protein